MIDFHWGDQETGGEEHRKGRREDSAAKKHLRDQLWLALLLNTYFIFTRRWNLADGYQFLRIIYAWFNLNSETGTVNDSTVHCENVFVMVMLRKTLKF